MKALIVAESQQGRLQDNWRELYAFCLQLQAESALFLVGNSEDLPLFPGTVHLADFRKYGDYAPKAHTRLLLEAVRREQADMVVLAHSAYGWDLAPRIARTLGAGQASEVMGLNNGDLVLPLCNGKLRRAVRITTQQAVVTLQSGAFSPAEPQKALPLVREIDLALKHAIIFLGYSEASPHAIDLSKYAVLVGAGNGVEDAELLQQIAELAQQLGGEWCATRPLVSAGLAQPFRQIGITGQTAAPTLYLACGISGGMQHLAGVRNAALIASVNTDRDAPISLAADIMVLADVKRFIPVLLQKLVEITQ